MIDLRHPLAVLANRMPWQEIENLDLFGPVSAVTAGVNADGEVLERYSPAGAAPGDSAASYFLTHAAAPNWENGAHNSAASASVAHPGPKNAIKSSTSQT